MRYLENVPLVLFSPTMFSVYRLPSNNFENYRLDEDMEKWKMKLLVMIRWPSGVQVSNAERRSWIGELKTRCEGRKNFRKYSLVPYLVLIYYNIDSHFHVCSQFSDSSFVWIIEKQSQKREMRLCNTYVGARKARMGVRIISQQKPHCEGWQAPLESKRGKISSLWEMPKSRSRLSKQFAVIMRTVRQCVFNVKKFEPHIYNHFTEVLDETVLQ